MNRRWPYNLSRWDLPFTRLLDVCWAARHSFSSNPFFATSFARRLTRESVSLLDEINPGGQQETAFWRNARKMYTLAALWHHNARVSHLPRTRVLFLSLSSLLLSSPLAPLSPLCLSLFPLVLFACPQLALVQGDLHAFNAVNGPFKAALIIYERLHPSRSSLCITHTAILTSFLSSNTFRDTCTYIVSFSRE